MATTHNSTALTQTGQNPVSLATVKSIPLTADEKVLVRKDEASKRKAYLKALEADAQTFVKGYQNAREIGEQAKALHRKFKDVVEEMRPVFERVREGFAHLRKGETVMGETTGDAWAQKHLGITYNWLCRCLNPPKAGRLLLTDGSKVLDPQAPKRKQSLPKPPTADTADWTDTQYIQKCVRFVATTLKPLESDPQRFVRLAEAIAAEILGEMGSDHSTGANEAEPAAENQPEVPANANSESIAAKADSDGGPAESSARPHKRGPMSPEHRAKIGAAVKARAAAKQPKLLPAPAEPGMVQ